MTVVIGTWITAVTAGAWSLTRYADTPGIAASTTEPVVSKNIARACGKATLIMTLHPQCPCSRASLNELEVLIARCHGKLSATVLFVDYPGLNPQQSDLWQYANSIPDVKADRDPGGLKCQQLHAQTSGQVFLYDAYGFLQFSGGITDSRGHAGDNQGLLAIEAIVNHQPPTTRSTPVYGCKLR